MTDDIDEVALNVLIADGVDPATAYVAAVQRDAKPPAPKVNRWAILVGVLIVLAWMILK